MVSRKVVRSADFKMRGWCMKTKSEKAMLLVASGLLCIAPSGVERVVAESLSVQVRESAVRAKPLFFAPSIASVRYGDSLQKLGGDSGGWTKVRVKSAEGFIPTASVTSDTIVLSARDIGSVKADASDVILAGKGFSKEVEQEYRKRDQSVRFDYVDKVESAGRVSKQEVVEFMKQGSLTREQ